MGFYENNLELLKSRHSIDLYNKELDTENYKLEVTSSGKHVLRIKKDSKWIYLGSKYAINNDIDNFLNDLQIRDSETDIYVIGLGFGYHIKELLKKLSHNKIVIIESNIEIINYAIQNEDLADILSDDRVKLITFTGQHELEFILRQSIDKYYVNYICVANYANYKVIYDNETVLIYKIIRKLLLETKMWSDTTCEHSQHYLDACLNNIPYILKSNNISELKNIFFGKTAVIVSSGPSLSKNMHFLKGYLDKVVIIAAGRNLKSMLQNGIRPHIVCAVDSEIIMYELMKDVLESDVPLVNSESTNDALVRNYKGNQVFWGCVFQKFLNQITGKVYDSLFMLFMGALLLLARRHLVVERRH